MYAIRSYYEILADVAGQDLLRVSEVAENEGAVENKDGLVALADFAGADEISTDRWPPSTYSVAKKDLVITSYSIHYTKLYEWGAIRERKIIMTECVRCDECEILYASKTRCPHWLLDAKRRQIDGGADGTRTRLALKHTDATCSGINNLAPHLSA